MKGLHNMTIEESVNANPAKFQSIVDTKTPDLQKALEELSSQLDVIFGAAIREYCESENLEFDIGDIPTYKAVNRIITGKIDEVAKEHIKDKRKDIT